MKELRPRTDPTRARKVNRRAWRATRARKAYRYTATAGAK